MTTKTANEMLQEYAILHNSSMTVGQRFTNEGQAKLDREVELLEILAAKYEMKTFDFVAKFERGEIK